MSSDETVSIVFMWQTYTLDNSMKQLVLSLVSSYIGYYIVGSQLRVIQSRCWLKYSFPLEKDYSSIVSQANNLASDFVIWQSLSEWALYMRLTLSNYLSCYIDFYYYTMYCHKYHMNLWLVWSTDCVAFVHCIVLPAGPLKSIYNYRNERVIDLIFASYITVNQEITTSKSL